MASKQLIQKRSDPDPTSVLNAVELQHSTDTESDHSDSGSRFFSRRRRTPNPLEHLDGKSGGRHSRSTSRRSPPRYTSGSTSRRSPPRYTSGPTSRRSPPRYTSLHTPATSKGGRSAIRSAPEGHHKSTVSLFSPQEVRGDRYAINSDPKGRQGACKQGRLSSLKVKKSLFPPDPEGRHFSYMASGWVNPVNIPLPPWPDRLSIRHSSEMRKELTKLDPEFAVLDENVISVWHAYYKAKGLTKDERDQLSGNLADHMWGKESVRLTLKRMIDDPKRRQEELGQFLKLLAMWYVVNGGKKDVDLVIKPRYCRKSQASYFYGFS